MTKTKQATTKTPDEIAREQVAAEEASRREARIAEIVAVEEARQEAERAAEQEQSRAADAARRLEDLRRRHERARREYGRPVGFNELVMPEERTTLYALCTEDEIEALKADIGGGR